MAASAAAASSSDAKISIEDNTYLERKGICETVDSMLQLACQTRAADPAQAFLVSLHEQTSVSALTRMHGDIIRDEKITKSKAWKDLIKESTQMPPSLVSLFSGNANRAEDFAINLALENDVNAGADKKNFLFADFSKNYMTTGARTQLINVAAAAKLQQAMEKMKGGEKINTTEKRAAFHVALRSDVGSDDIKKNVQAELKKIEKIAASIRDGSWKGSSGKAITTIVHIGIGGSNLGTQLAVEALAPVFNGGKNAIATHFVASLDGAVLQTVLAKVDLETTVFVVAGKTFSTGETNTLAEEAKKAVVAKFAADKSALSKHFIAATAAPERATAFGVAPENVVAFWDFVGGRFSVWSGVSVTIAIACGFENFRQFLDGAKAMDSHFFETAELQKNIPAMMALTGIFNFNVLGYSAHAVVPYASRLSCLPAFLQQLEMESNGKSINAETNRGIDLRTSPIVLGGTGPEAQHSFFQLLHQGNNPVSVDFIGAAQAQQASEGANQAKLVANMFAQGRALMTGLLRHEISQELSKGNERLTAEEMNHRLLPGSKSNSTFLFKKITPMALGALLAAYEHKVFVQGVIWGVDSFDQFGVEQGKKIAASIAPQLGKDKPAVSDYDNSTNALINLFNANA